MNLPGTRGCEPIRHCARELGPFFPTVRWIRITDYSSNRVDPLSWPLCDVDDRSPFKQVPDAWVLSRSTESLDITYQCVRAPKHGVPRHMEQWANESWLGKVLPTGCFYLRIPVLRRQHGGNPIRLYQPLMYITRGRVLQYEGSTR